MHEKHNSRVWVQKQLAQSKYVRGTLCAPIVDAVPRSVVFICDLFDLPGIISRVLPQKMSGHLIEGSHCILASTQVLEKNL